MEAITQIMDADQLPSIFDIPDEMKYGQVEITIRKLKPYDSEAEEKKREKTRKAIETFRAKYPYEKSFDGPLKKQLGAKVFNG